MGERERRLHLLTSRDSGSVCSIAWFYLQPDFFFFFPSISGVDLFVYLHILKSPGEVLKTTTARTSQLGTPTQMAGVGLRLQYLKLPS